MPSVLHTQGELVPQSSLSLDCIPVPNYHSGLLLPFLVGNTSLVPAKHCEQHSDPS